MIKIFADFNAMTADGKRVFIGTTQNPELYPGFRVLIQEPNDFEVEAVVELDIDGSGREWWYIVPDWSTRRDLPLSTED